MPGVPPVEKVASRKKDVLTLGEDASLDLAVFKKCTTFFMFGDFGNESLGYMQGCSTELFERILNTEIPLHSSSRSPRISKVHKDEPPRNVKPQYRGSGTCEIANVFCCEKEEKSSGHSGSVINIDAEAPLSESSALTKAVVGGNPRLQAPKFSEQTVKKPGTIETDVDVIDPPLRHPRVLGSYTPAPPPIEQAVYSKAAALNSRSFAESPPSSKSVYKYQLVSPTDR
ncbi:hypothetical protein BGY98DRAFT_1178026 [Russula aff. rugulosa BPL654]|nr:hypothetical protein BGY98DRAFT_1178026 [Russula aff. rugulosa BPL654]